MSSEVWYRKWRPQSFAEVVGQPHVTRTLARGVQLNRVAHAYLFCGPRGTGKTSTARILAKAVNCETNEEGQPCGRCESCIAVKEGRALDLIEMDAASNRGIDEIRSLRDKVGYSPNSSRYKVYLIDEVHELTQFAFDALLKTLEEPPPHVIFVLATTEAHRVPETILSRCQRFDFVRIKLADVVERLRQIGDAEGVQADDEALELIARRATGSLRDAVNLFEQAVASQGQAVTGQAVRAASGVAADGRAGELVRALLDRRLAESLEIVVAARDDGRDLRQLTREAVQQLRTLLLVRAGADASLGLDEEALQELRQAAGAYSVRELLKLAKTLAAVDFRADPQSPLPLELAIVECIEEPAQVAAPAVRADALTAVGRTPAAAPPKPPAAVSASERLRSLRAPAPLDPLPAKGTGGANGTRAAASPPASPDGLGLAVPSPSSPKPADTPTTNALIAQTQATPVGRPTEAAVAPATAAAAPNAPATPANPAPVAAGPTLQEAQRRFRELYERSRAIDPKTGRLLLGGGCDIVEIGDDRLVVGFQHANMVRLAASPAYEPFLRQAVNDVFGVQYDVQMKHVPDVPKRLDLLDSERPSHLLDEALKLGAKPVGSS